jgi:hypothetical protein
MIIRIATGLLRFKISLRLSSENTMIYCTSGEDAGEITSTYRVKKRIEGK